MPPFPTVDLTVATTQPAEGQVLVVVRQPLPMLPGMVDITDYLSLPQAVAAQRLGMPVSTLSKRWREAVPTRKWPYRAVLKLDKEIMTLLCNVPQGQPVPADIETPLALLVKRRSNELNKVIIRK